MRLFRLAAFFGLIVVLSSTVYAQTLPPGVQKVTSIEGITDYAFPNGLHALLFPDLPDWAFPVMHIGFALLVLATF